MSAGSKPLRIKDVDDDLFRYKVPYADNNDHATSHIFSDNITPFAFTSGLGCLIGYLMLKEE